MHPAKKNKRLQQQVITDSCLHAQTAKDKHSVYTYREVQGKHDFPETFMHRLKCADVNGHSVKSCMQCLNSFWVCTVQCTGMEVRHEA